jgi:hypothetical protein
MRRIMLLVVVAVVMALTLAVGTAGAHEHQICTPGQGDPKLDQEPFHTEDPSNGAILNNPNVTDANYARWGLHPIHHFLHVGPSADNREITVVRTDTAACPA